MAEPHGQATRELLALMIRQNGIRAEDVASAVFSTTPDLDAEFPALAARQLEDPKGACGIKIRHPRKPCARSPLPYPMVSG